MSNVFQSVKMARVKSNTFDLGHDVKYSTGMGLLTPVLVQECLPGDKFNISTETLIRFAPLVAPVMHNIKVFTHYFFVPNRILWDHWEEFISPDLAKDTPPAAPTLTWTTTYSSYHGVGTLWDYLGLPPQEDGLTPSEVPKVSAIPFAAYQCIYNEFYRDQNLQTEQPYKLKDGQTNQINQLGGIQRRSWMHDYFTSALPFAQKGPAVDIPIGDFNDVDVVLNDVGNPWLTERVTDGSPGSGDLSAYAGTAPPAPGAVSDSVGTLRLDPQGTLTAQTSELEASATTINDLRVAFKMQEWFEKAARGGSRYVEQLMVHWNVRSSDARLNRPEFLGGTRNPVIISEVLQTSSSDDSTPQATMAGHGISVNSGKRISYFCEEHGYIIGIQSIMPNTAYQQGIPRHFSRYSWEDYAWPTFAHLGEQAILNKEIYVDDDDKNEDTFGYIPRYSEYRYSPSRVAGAFRDSLAFWHLGRIFANRPALNSQFILCNPRNDIFAVPGEAQQNLWCHSYNKVFVRRRLPQYGTPML